MKTNKTDVVLCRQEDLSEARELIRLTEPVIGYKLEREGRPGWVHAGTTAKEIAAFLLEEIENDFDIANPDADDHDTITLTPYETTQEEIDALEEFQGW